MSELDEDKNITLDDGEAAIVFRNDGRVDKHYFQGSSSDKISDSSPLFASLLVAKLFDASDDESRKLLLTLRRAVIRELPKPALVPLADGAKGTCGRCYSEADALYESNCDDDPQAPENGNQGMYHCTDCGAMVLGGMPHPPLCLLCTERRHPQYDLGEKPPYREPGSPLKVIYAPGSFDWFEGTPEELAELKADIEEKFSKGLPKDAKAMTDKDMEELAKELKARGKNTRQ